MSTLVTTWNLARPDQENLADPQEIERRGYNLEQVSLTGQLANKIADKDILRLSVSNIADKRCNARRDLYLEKGRRRLTSSELSKIQKTTWGQKAGILVQKHTEGVIAQSVAQGRQSYAITRQARDVYHIKFFNDYDSTVAELRALEDVTATTRQGDTDWLLRLLKCNSSLELGAKILNSLAQEDGDVDSSQFQFNLILKLKTGELGLSNNAAPDFIAPNLRLVGDIKTSVVFEPHFQFTCAGYALVYENIYGVGKDINWGAIYLISTRNPSALVRPLTFAQLIIFAIDDNLRQWFLNERDKVYRILALDEIPLVDKEDLIKNCPYCRYKAYCNE